MFMARCCIDPPAAGVGSRVVIRAHSTPAWEDRHRVNVGANLVLRLAAIPFEGLSVSH
jgi:hypothetical protein